MKEQQIEELNDFILSHLFEGSTWLLAENLYNAGYRKIADGAVILTPEERDEEMKAQNEKQAELENEIYALKVQIECLEEHCTALEEDNINDEMNLDSLSKEIERLEAENKKRMQASEDFATKHCYMKCEIAKTLVKEFAEKVKNLLYTVYGNYGAPLGDLAAEDIACEIDELLKEYLNDSDK